MKASSARVRMGSFELDLRSGELRSLASDGAADKVVLREQPFQVLRMLVEQEGKIVTRSEIKKRLWPNDTIVEFDHIINVAIGALRRALGDSAASPRYIETLARRGYRLLPPVEWLDSGAPAAEVAATPKTSPLADLIGTRVCQYRVLEVLGGGGMGRVYRAEDLKLGRGAALKFLPEELAGDPIALQRLEREAQTASALNHPNICTIYDIEDYQGQPFIAMELLEGETLQQHLAASAPNAIPVLSLIDIATQVCLGLEAAHDKDIVHRDIKPANILLTKQGPVKLLDFGVAKLVANETVADEGVVANGDKGFLPSVQPNLTRTGATVGTTGYMSPEQIRKEELDGRSDLFSLGMVLYEMATGHRAFTGETAVVVQEAILTKTPPPVETLNRDMPASLATVIRKALEKDRSQRYQTATDLRQDLERVRYQFTANVSVVDAADTSLHVHVSAPDSSRDVAPPVLELPPKETVPTARRRWRIAAALAAAAVIVAAVGYTSWRRFSSRTPPEPSRIMLAVLPFKNLTGDPNKEYLADGLTEEMISQLARLNPEQLRVIARTSVMGYKQRDKRLDQIGRDLSVQYVLENSLRESGDHLRLTAQLIQVKDQTHVWSQNYDYTATDILNIEDDVARSVARQIQLRLTSQQQEDLARSRPINPEAFDAYLQGYHFFQGSTDKDAELAATYFERATQLDPSYALAWAYLSRARNWQANEGLIPMEEGRRLAREAVERALSLNPNLAVAHAQTGRLKQAVDYDWAGANASYQRAITLEPGNPEYLGSAALTAACFGRFDEALQLAHRGVDLDPLNAGSWEALAESEFFMGRLDQSAADSKKALEVNPDHFSSPINLSRIYLLQGRPQDALREIERVRINAHRAYLYALTYYALGRKKESDAALRELMMKYGASNAFEIAAIYTFRSQTDEAFEWLDRGYAQRDPSMICTRVEPLLKSLHNDARYAAFLKKLNLPN